MSSKLDERYLRVYCPTHKVSFSVMEVGQIVCEGGGEALARNFPYEAFWEYCCNCQSFWPSNLSKGGKAAEQCLACNRETNRRYVCNQCKLISLESGEAVRRQLFTISRGVVEPSCPGCMKTSVALVIREHECDEAGAEFTTAHISCPFCNEQIADRPTFPALATEYLEKIKIPSVTCKFDSQQDRLVEAGEGEFLLLPDHNGSIILPKQTHFSNKRDYYSYKDFYNCDEPAIGEVFIIYPATAIKLDTGWRLKEVGRLKVNRAADRVETPIEEANKAAEPQVICPYCHTVGQPEHTFCKECGYNLKAQESPLDEQDVRGYQVAEAEQNLTGAPAPQHTNRLLSFLVPIAVCAALIMVIIAVVKLSGSSSVENKLEAAINKGNLLSPQGESAYDHYQQLKREGADKNTLTKFENRLLPMLTSRSQDLLRALAKPDGRDATPAEWEEALRLLSWAVELKPGDSGLAARADYCKGRLAYLEKRMDEALGLWKSAGNRDQAWGLPINDSGNIYLKEKSHKNFEAARELFNEAIRREKDWAVPYLNVGHSYWFQARYDEARPFYEEAARLAPDWPRPHAALGNLAKIRGNNYWATNDFALARDEYYAAQRELEQALELSTNFPHFKRENVDKDLTDVRQRLQQLNY
jgi:tetratricopeptide (TPR) repeat protein